MKSPAIKFVRCTGYTRAQRCIYFARAWARGPVGYKAWPRAHQQWVGVMQTDWTLDDINWAAFDPSLVDRRLLTAIKAACLVEYNAAAYSAYLKIIFRDDPETHVAFDQWAREETQHGLALGRWAALADPSFNMESATNRFRSGYKPVHFETGEAARGGRIGEMIARCVVESGTSSFYSAVRDAAAEPVLKQIALHIAADEYKHYRVFFDMMQRLSERRPNFLKRLWIAVSRLVESQDDELAFAYYCANVPECDVERVPYNRQTHTLAYEYAIMRQYQRRHIEKMMGMVAVAVGAHPKGRFAAIGTTVIWGFLRRKARRYERVRAMEANSATTAS